MAIPEGYRLIKSTDVGKTFGVDLEPFIYIDTTVSAYDSLHNEFYYGLTYPDSTHKEWICVQWDYNYAEIDGIYVITPNLTWNGTWWPQDALVFTPTDMRPATWKPENVTVAMTYDYTGYTITAGAGVAQADDYINWLYVKDIGTPKAVSLDNLKQFKKRCDEKYSKGNDGVTFTPKVDNRGNLSWTNNGGLTNPTTVNIKGSTGPQGASVVNVHPTTELEYNDQQIYNLIGQDITVNVSESSLKTGDIAIVPYYHSDIFAMRILGGTINSLDVFTGDLSIKVDWYLN